MPELTTPTTDLHKAWLDCRDDFGRDVHQDGSGLHPGDDVDSPAGFEAWLARLRADTDPSRPPAPGRVRCTYWWITEGDTVQGSIALRHELNDFLLRAGGNIGYSVRPSARRRGLATWALQAVLVEARALGLERALVTCNVTNEPSRRTIESAGGVLEDERDTDIGHLYRYWITLR